MRFNHQDAETGIMNEISTTPISRGQTWFALVMIVFLFTAIGFILFAMAQLFVQLKFVPPGSQASRKLVVPLLIAEAIPGFLFGLWFARKTLNKQYWQLTDTELSCGISRQQKFPLDSIDKIIVGLPVPGLVKLFGPAGPGTSLAKENSLLICFKDGSLLPLRLFLLPNGSLLMEELKRRCKDRVIESYNYSDEELRRLRRRDVNELIPAK